MPGKKIDKSKIRQILIRATNWVGDAVMTLPALEAVRENFPSSSITVMAKTWVEPIFNHHPAVDRVLIFNKGEGAFTGFGEMIRVVREIRKGRFDLAILFQNAFEAALLTYLGGAVQRLGYSTDGRGFLLTHRIILDDQVLKIHQSEYYLSILRGMGWGARSRDPALHVSQGDGEAADRILGSEGIKAGDLLIGLSPGAIFGGAKRWPPERFAEIGDRAVEEWGARVLVFGSCKERAICSGVCSSMRRKALNLCGRTSLSEVMGLISRCCFFVTNDSGLMHVAAALSVPTVAIFGSTDHITTGPRGPKTRIVRHETECAPCLKPECPTDHRCMSGIGSGEVWEAMEKMRGEIN
ncbi:MAG: lipopolysaccharide heptosyltransferase II [Desulfobacterales bacterium]|nr:lipopolysaccharide heptosyltransferase II [Desulfobacterales bacterium]MBL7101353.1 lipopolysaccharide heptosyltransferase II [Desulfobacteraceae bacterium]MBL7171591.1 lipopolysaccharide heptosyltransferase II [Desulfobacteraceae bacterium]